MYFGKKIFKSFGYDIINTTKKKKKKYFTKYKKNRTSFYSNVKSIFIKLFVVILGIYITFFCIPKKIKIAICTMAKLENLYIKEFIEYYEKLGIDNIFIYDDNDEGKERIKDVAPNTKKIKVEIYDNIKDRIKKQADAYTECYNNNKKNFD